jgi:hypothetical protein
MASKLFPRPNGGAEPIAQGVTDKYPDGSAPYSPGYDFSGSLDGASTADARKGYVGRTKLKGTGSDGMKTA